MIHIHGLGDAGPLKKRARIGPKVWIIDDPAFVTLEV
jgi:hypothetical protein